MAVVKYTGNDTNIHCLATDGSGYATLALLNAAGKVAFPGVPPHPSAVVMRTEDGSGGAGARFYFRINGDTAPADATTMQLVGNTDQMWTEPGLNPISRECIEVVWFKKETAGDVFSANALYG